jgi:uncharacterized protein (DUF58 family)
MRIGKPLLLVITPIGVAGGLIEAYRLAGGLVLLMIAQLALVGAAVAMIVVTIRREREREREKERTGRSEK